MCGRGRCTLNAHQVAQACGLSPLDASSVPTQHLDRFFFKLKNPSPSISRVFNPLSNFRYRPSYNVAPGAYLPVFRLQRSPATSSGVGEAAPAPAPGPVVHCMKWGLVPSFTKKMEKPDHYRMFNARSESVREKASFRRLLPKNRCLVAVEGFYEWKKDGSKKQPYYIHFKDNRPLVFAALYDSWENSEGEVLHTFTILTTRSSSALEWLHDRMPVILRDTGSIDLWLNDSMAKHETVLGPCEDLDLVWYPVTPAMGKPSFDGPECSKEIQLKASGEKPLPTFFTKKSEVKCEPEPESLKSSKQEHDPSNLKEEPGSDDVEQKVIDEEEDSKKPEISYVKRGLEEMENPSQPKHENLQSNQTSPVKKKVKSVKNTDDKQSSLLSYFGRS